MSLKLNERWDCAIYIKKSKGLSILSKILLRTRERGGFFHTKCRVVARVFTQKERSKGGETQGKRNHDVFERTE